MSRVPPGAFSTLGGSAFNKREGKWRMKRRKEKKKKFRNKCIVWDE